jgi:hypothetical protein
MFVRSGALVGDQWVFADLVEQAAVRESRGCHSGSML